MHHNIIPLHPCAYDGFNLLDPIAVVVLCTTSAVQHGDGAQGLGLSLRWQVAAGA